jgi:Tfp pilus assembly protein PilN
MATSQPQENRKRRRKGQGADLSNNRLARLLITAGAVLLLVPLFMLSMTLQRSIAGLDAASATMQASATKIAGPNEQLANLEATRTAARGAIEEVDGVSELLGAERIPWDSVLGVIEGYDWRRISIESMIQEGRTVTLKGRALDESSSMAYVRALSASSIFEQVVVRSLKSSDIPFEPSAAPVLMPILPSGPPPTPTARPSRTGDLYQENDAQVSTIQVGQAQRNTFYPAYHVDQIAFEGRAGRRYRIMTYDLAPGVDTFITLLADGIVYSNDDISPTEVRSMVALHKPLAQDQTVILVITNRGVYGPDEHYDVLVQDITDESPAPASILISDSVAHMATATPTKSTIHEPRATSSPLSLDHGSPSGLTIDPISSSGSPVISAHPLNAKQQAAAQPTRDKASGSGSVEFVITLDLAVMTP